jgi:gliding motility-associated-like protein
VVYTIDDTDWVNPTLEITGLPAGTYTYYFYVVCTGQEIPVDVEIFPIPEVVFNPTPVTCFGAGDGKIRIASGGLATQLYYVDGGPALTQAELENLSFVPKVYDIRVEQAGVGCPANFQIEVLGPAAALAVESLTQIDPGCGSDIGIIRTKIIGGWAPYEVTLFKDGIALGTQSISGPQYEASNLAPGDYYLSITDAEGCPITSNTVTLVYGPSLVLVDDIEICESETAVLKPTINPVNANATFEWFKNSALTIPIVSSPNPDANGHIFQIAADGTLSVSGLNNTDSPVTYYVRAVGAGVCQGFVADPTVEIFDQPTVTASVQDEVCYGDNGIITFTGAGGSGTYEFSLDGSSFQSSPQFSATPGTHTATVRSGGCESTISGIVVNGSAAEISNSTPLVSNPTCGETNGVIAFQIAGGYGNYSVESFKNGQSIGTTSLADGNFELQNQTAGTYTFEIVDSAGCLFIVTQAIDLVDGLTPLDAPDQEICEGEVASITPSSSQIGISPTYTWYQNSDGTGQITSGTVSGIGYQVGSDGTLNITGLPGKATPYTYYVGISGPGTCPPPLKAVDVMVFPIPNLRVSNPSIVCDPNGTVDLTEFIEGFNSSVYDYQIQSPSGTVMRLDEIQSVNESGSYIVQSSVKGANCWTPAQRILVKITDTELVPEFNYQFDLGGGNILVNMDVQILEPVEFLDISLGDVVIWNWDFGDGGNSTVQNPTHTFNTKGIFTVTLTTIDKIGCVGTYQRVIEVRDDYMIMIPNAFTPSGAKNIFFKPQFRGITSMEFYVFNTWGELIFEANSLETYGWDGTWKGKDVPNGNYVYKAIFQTRSGQKVEKAGVFILIR